MAQRRPTVIVDDARVQAALKRDLDQQRIRRGAHRYMKTMTAIALNVRI
jgi:hypothetical protein